MSTLLSYNGFSAAERRAIGPSIAAALATGAVKLSRSCAMCAVVAEKPLGFHSERYDRVEVYPICRQCHYWLHMRFRRPDGWTAYVARLDPDGWFQMLSVDPACLTQPFDLTYPGGLARPLPPR